MHPITLMERIKNAISTKEEKKDMVQFNPMTFDLPKGFTDKHIKAEVNNGMLTIRGGRRTRIKNTGERRYTAFVYSEYAPGIKQENVTTSVKDGVLTVNVQNPKQE